MGVRSLGVLSLGVRSLEVLSLSVRSLGLLSLRVQSLGVLSLGVRSLGVLHMGALRRLVSSLPGAAVSIVAPLVPRRSTLVGVSLSPHSSCVSGTLAVRVALLELGALLREALGLEALELTLSLSPHSSCVSGTLAVRVALLELVTLLLEALLLELLEPLAPEVLVLEVLKLQGLEVLLVLGVLPLETMRLETLGLEVPVLGVLLVVVLVLEVLALEDLELLEVLVLEVLALEVLELLAVLALGALELLVLLALEILELLAVLVLEVLALEVLELLAVLALGALELLVMLVLEVLELQAVLALEVLAQEVLELLEVLALEVLEVLTVLALAVLVLEVLALKVLELLEVLAIEVLELLAVLALEALELLVLVAVHSRGLAEHREPASRPVSPVCTVRTGRRVPRECPPAVPGTHLMALRPSSAPQRVPLPSLPASSLPDVPHPESDSARAAHPTVTRLLATVVTDPSFESTAASALVAELVDFAAACRLDYAASLVAETESVCPPSVGGECALGTDVLEGRQDEFQCFAVALPHLMSMLLAREIDPDAPDIPTPCSYAEAIEGPYSSHWQTSMDAEMASWKSTSPYINEVPLPGANIVDGMWIFRVKRPPGSPPVFKARYVARGFSQRQGVDYFHTFSPTPKMTTLRVLLHIAAQRDYELHSLDFSTAFVQGSLHEEIWLCRPPGFTGSFPPGTQWSLRRPVYCLRQAPREWHDTLRTTLAALGFAPSTADPSLFLRTDITLPPFYILVYVDDLVFATAEETHVHRLG
ncbi:unnamed protein product [Closterium sp. NIES-65]|nr:unnamed protein product [Closterium sp. NIES-65]